MTYEEMIASKPVVLVEFYATWCPHCRQMVPVVDQIKMLVEGQAEIVQLDIDRNQAAADAYRITSTPTFILYSDGKEVWRQAGEMDGDYLLEKVQSYI